jgi:hypothetical protein
MGRRSGQASMLAPFRAPNYVEWDELKTTIGRRVPGSTPHNAALHMSHKMWSSTSYDGSGLWVCAKRLEKGRFRWPEADNVRSVTMRAEELAMLVNGLDWKQTEPRAWYRKSS